VIVVLVVRLLGSDVVPKYSKVAGLLALALQHGVQELALAGLDEKRQLLGFCIGEVIAL